MINQLYEITVKINQLNKAFTEKLQWVLQDRKIYDISPTQVLLIKNLGKETKNITDIGNNGYYVGKNISYNIKNLVHNGYLTCIKNDRDRRGIRAELTNKGLEILDIFDCVLKSQTEWLQDCEWGDIDMNAIDLGLITLEMSIKNG